MAHNLSIYWCCQTVEQAMESMQPVSEHGERSSMKSRNINYQTETAETEQDIGSLQRYLYQLHHREELKFSNNSSLQCFRNCVFRNTERQNYWHYTLLWKDGWNTFWNALSDSIHNCCMWSTEHSHLRQILCKPHVTVWCGLTTDFLIQSIFFHW